MTFTTLAEILAQDIYYYGTHKRMQILSYLTNCDLVLYQLPMEGAKVILEPSVAECEVYDISASLGRSKNLEQTL